MYLSHRNTGRRGDVMPDMQTEMKKVVGEKDDNMPKTARAVPQVEQKQTNAPQGEKKRVQRHRVVGSVAPLIELVHILGSQAAAAHAIGLTPSGINSLMAHNSCSKSVEIAATLTLKEIERRRRKPEAAPTTRVILLRVPADKHSAVVVMCEALGVTRIDMTAMMEDDV